MATNLQTKSNEKQRVQKAENAEKYTLKNPMEIGVSELLNEYQKSLNKGEDALTLAYGCALISSHNFKKLGQAAWSICEYVHALALEYCEYEWAMVSFKHLSKRWPKSERVSISEGLCHEASENVETALKFYGEGIVFAPHNELMRKRLIAHLRNHGRIKDCVLQLNSHLDEYYTDVEAWHELGEIYLEQGHFSYASFCFEELVMLEISNLYYLLTYAEIQHTMENPDIAIPYICRMILSDDSNTRGLWDLVLAVYDQVSITEAKSSGNRKRGNLADRDTSTSKTQSQYVSIALHASKKLRDIYTVENEVVGSMDIVFASACRRRVLFYIDFLESQIQKSK